MYCQSNQLFACDNKNGGVDAHDERSSNGDANEDGVDNANPVIHEEMPVNEYEDHGSHGWQISYNSALQRLKLQKSMRTMIKNAL